MRFMRVHEIVVATEGQGEPRVSRRLKGGVLFQEVHWLKSMSSGTSYKQVRAHCPKKPRCLSLPVPVVVIHLPRNVKRPQDAQET